MENNLRRSYPHIFQKKLFCYNGGEVRLDQAIDSGKLYVDVMATAYVSRAICSAAAGDYEAAHADLDEMEKASSPESVGEF